VGRLLQGAVRLQKGQGRRRAAPGVLQREGEWRRSTRCSRNGTSGLGALACARLPSPCCEISGVCCCGDGSCCISCGDHLKEEASAGTFILDGEGILAKSAVAAKSGGPLSGVVLKGGRKVNGDGAGVVLGHSNLRMLFRVAEEKHQLGSPTSVTIACCGPVLRPLLGR
jgi:hypothetical protein